MFHRLHVAFLLSLFLTFTSAFAESIPATTGEYEPTFGLWNPGNNGYIRSTAQAACADYVPYYYGSAGVFQSVQATAIKTVVKCAVLYNGSISTSISVSSTAVCHSGDVYNQTSQMCTGYICPSGQSWTLQGSSCTRPDCPSGITRSPDGTCTDPCQPKIDLGTKFGIYNFPVGTSITGTYCDGGCRLSIGVTTEPYYTDGKTNTKVMSQTYGSACQATDGPAPQPGLPGQTPPNPPKKAPCAAGEGVMTSSTGAVHCVPSGTPGSNPPVVTKDKTTTTNADGSTTTKETTTTRDPATGVEEKTTNTTTRDAGGSVTSATSETGTKGTTSAGDPNKPQGNEFCEKNPTLQICKGGLNEEETQKKVKEAAEKVRDFLDAKDTNPDSFFEGKEVSQAAKDEVSQKADAVKAEIESLAEGGPGATYYPTFKEQMGNWFEPISTGGCHAFTVHVGSWTWTHDHCEVAAKISEIGAYCMWVMLAFSVFSMTTKDHR